MKQRLLLFGLLGLFWMIFFTVGRIVFLVYHHTLTSELSALDIATILVLGSRMDAAISADCLILTGLLLTVSCFRNWKALAIANHIIVGIFVGIATLVIVADLELYRHWGFRMDNTPLMYIGSEGAGSLSAGVAIGLAFVALCFVIPAWWAYRKKIAPRFAGLPTVRPLNALSMLLVTGLLFIPIRSSFSVAPLNTGVVYFHKTKPFANHAGINVIWNFFESVADDHKHLYPEDFFDAYEAQKMITSANGGSGVTTPILNAARPNVLLIVLESFTARIVEPLGGVPGITPNLNALAHEGILFDNFYASGDRTDKGIIALLSAYPAQPGSSIIKYPSKTEHLPFLSSSLEKLGYHTSFVYGGDIGFANMESYLTTAGFSHVTEDDDFPSELNESKWGVHDHIVFNRLLEECDTAKGPFFKVMLSLSSHEPFDVPVDKPLREVKSELDLFLNACHYTDQSLGDFIRQAKTKDWWKNTWVIITADHGHRFPDTEELQDKGRFRIPMLWLGGAVAKKDSVIHTFAGQTDIANTIMGQLDKRSGDFTFSKNALDRSVTPYAVYVFHNGYGYIDLNGEYIYDFDLGGFANRSGEPGDIGKAYMQTLFSDYNKR